jgi:hypothetical protein
MSNVKSFSLRASFALMRNRPPKPCCALVFILSENSRCVLGRTMNEAASSTIPDYSWAVIDHCKSFIAAALFLLPLPAQP